MNPDPDFNDLDKAVSSLVGNTSKNAAKPVDSPQPPVVNSKDSSQLKPHASRGRFMDVMHPSSNMATSTPTTPTTPTI